MQSATLRGIFPEPKPVHRKNFIKENMRHIKRLQGLSEDEGNQRDKYRNVPHKPIAQIHTEGKSQSRQSISQAQPALKLQRTSKSNKSIVNKTTEPKRLIKNKRPDGGKAHSEERFSERAVQTERVENVKKLYENGVIKYPSPNIVRTLMDSRRRPKALDQGDLDDNLCSKMGDMEVDCGKNYIKQNIEALKVKSGRQEGNSSSGQIPPNYQKGVVPKYLRNRKDDDREIPDPACPPGHVLLPEEERKETLRVLRQSYADRIQELNSMPVRNDTLRMKKRKAEIEEELKRIDEGIKVFQRPKVFVKINA